jgi:ribosomal protein S1
VGDTVRLIVQDVDILRRRLSLALEKLEVAHQAEAEIQPLMPLTAVAGDKRAIEPLGAAGSSGSGAKRRKQ